MRKLNLHFLFVALLIILCVGNLQAAQQVKNYSPGSRGTVLLFVASMCPCTDAHRLLVDNLVAKAEPQGFNFYCVFPNSMETKDLAEYFFKNIGWKMPYLLDHRSKLTDQFGITHTPECVVLTPDKRVLYRGPIDDSVKNQGRVIEAYLPEAVNARLEGKDIPHSEVEPTGCWIVRDTEPRAEAK